MRLLSILSSFVLLLFLPVSGGQRLSCDLCDLRIYCDCSSQGFSSIPMVTQQAIALDLSFNAITVVTEDDLHCHAPLIVLRLHANRIAEVSAGAFRRLQVLQVLDLSHNLLASLNPSWFTGLDSLHTLNLLDNPYRVLGGPGLLQEVYSLRRLGIGGAALEELRRGDLGGVTELEELRLKANNLQRYDPGSLAAVWPLARAEVHLGGPVLWRRGLASALLWDVSAPDTTLLLHDLHLTSREAIRSLANVARRRVRSLSLYNVSLSDESIISFLQVSNRAPLSSLSLVNVTLTGMGRWEPASLTEHQNLDEILIRDLHLQDTYEFSSMLQLGFLLTYPRKLSLIGCQVFAMPCLTSLLLINLHFLDLSDNLLTDLTLQEAFCRWAPVSTLADLRVLNISGNPLKSLSLLVAAVSGLSRLIHLDVSHTAFSSMPVSCSWPPGLRHLNLSWAKLAHVGPCLPSSLEVLDLSHNDLQDLLLVLPRLKELHVSGNKLLDLPAGWRFPRLHTLTIQSNTLILFSASDLRTFGCLHNLEAAHNKFLCSCGFVSLIQALGQGSGPGSGLTLSDGVDLYMCDSPLRLRGQRVATVALGPAACQPLLFVGLMCGAGLVVGAGLAALLHRLHAFWYLRMMWAWLGAKRARRRRREEGGGASGPAKRYDAFVSYSQRDAHWVEELLVPQLEQPCPEEEQEEEETPAPLVLCLHNRDFLPGRWVVDNIMSAMEASRRTIFVLSENFLSSDWCRHEFHVSQGGLGAPDHVLVLLGALGPDHVPARFCRLRRLMASNTYLEWPQEELKRRDFWRKLRNAVREE